jgi:hypothetical protein
MMNRPEQEAHDIPPTDGLIAAWLRGEVPPADSLPADVLERVLYHGVSALLVARPEVIAALPPTLRDAIRQQALGEAMWDLQHRRVLAPLLEDLAREGIRTAVLKGTALACSVYPSPALRPRGDTDLLADPAHAGKIHAILKRHGFARAKEGLVGPSARVARQEYWKAEVTGSSQDLDLHWSLINHWSLADLLPTSEVLASAQPLPGLSPNARRIAAEAALYHACIHRAGHVQSPYHVGGAAYYGGDRLIWFYDMHLLAPHLTSEDWSRFIDRCRKDDTADLCLEALDKAAALFGSAMPPDVLTSLKAIPRTGRVSRHLLQASPTRRFLSDLAHVPGFDGKLGLIRMMLFPPEDFMRTRYPGYESWPLWALYPLRLFLRLRKRREKR